MLRRQGKTLLEHIILDEIRGIYCKNMVEKLVLERRDTSSFDPEEKSKKIQIETKAPVEWHLGGSVG